MTCFDLLAAFFAGLVSGLFMFIDVNADVVVLFHVACSFLFALFLWKAIEDSTEFVDLVSAGWEASESKHFTKMTTLGKMVLQSVVDKVRANHRAKLQAALAAANTNADGDASDDSRTKAPDDKTKAQVSPSTAARVLGEASLLSAIV